MLYEQSDLFLCTSPDGDDAVQCTLQEGLVMDDKPVWACQPRASNSTLGRHGSVQMAAQDVSDLGLMMEDLEVEIPLTGGSSVVSSGYESTSRVATVRDDGCEWEESAEEVTAILTIQGLRGQPAGALSVDWTANTATITAFGMAVWSCVLRGEVASPELASSEVLEGDDMLPVVHLAVRKQPGARRWGGFIASVGEDSLL